MEKLAIAQITPTTYSGMLLAAKPKKIIPQRILPPPAERQSRGPSAYTPTLFGDGASKDSPDAPDEPQNASSGKINSCSIL